MYQAVLEGLHAKLKALHDAEELNGYERYFAEDMKKLQGTDLKNIHATNEGSQAG